MVKRRWSVRQQFPEKPCWTLVVGEAEDDIVVFRETPGQGAGVTGRLVKVGAVGGDLRPAQFHQQQRRAVCRDAVAQDRVRDLHGAE